MMSQPVAVDRLLRRRVELKYLLWPGETEAVLSRLRAARSDPRFRSTDGLVRTVYLDRPDGRLTRAACERPLRNVKLRIRDYFTPDGGSASPTLWVDVKERDGRLSTKSRFRLDRRLLARFLDGRLDDDDVPEDGLEAFRRVRDVAGAGPLVPIGAVGYRRLAVEGGDPVARVTFDREVSYHAGPLDLELVGGAWDGLGPPALGERVSILELKYGGGTPWFVPDVEPVEYSKFNVLSALVHSHVD